MGELKGLFMKYFVLSPRKNDAHGRASREAVRAYAANIATHDPELAEDLFRWVQAIEDGVTVKMQG